MKSFGLMPWVLVFGLAGCGGGTPNLEAACQRACTAMYRVPCQGMDADMCRAGCPMLEQQMTTCQAENAALYNCAGGLQYECTDNGPMPTTTGCVEQSMALVTCMQDAPCKGHCLAVIESDCGYSDQDDCLEACAEKIEQADSCDWELEDLYECHGRFGVRCVNGEVISPEDCEREVLDYADCLSYENPCLGHCLAAQVAGCGDDQEACLSDCQAAASLHPDCDWEFDSLLECHARDGVDCQAGVPVSNEDCSWDQESYEECIAP